MFHHGTNYVSESARSSASAAKSSAAQAKSQVDYLKTEVERLLMITEALWGFIKEQHDYEDQALFDKIIEIDAKDGKIDGRVAPKAPTKCPECTHVLPKKKPFCVYCGAKITKDCFER
ncbi:MAG: hypothetical protein COA99_06545 [Moraxellaceae bacterium]|nr:MAG: hypothetical protein COA99_06545 [Moraxellaceae bacterium]